MQSKIFSDRLSNPKSLEERSGSKKYQYIFFFLNNRNWIIISGGERYIVSIILKISEGFLWGVKQLPRIFRTIRTTVSCKKKEEKIVHYLASDKATCFLSAQRDPYNLRIEFSEKQL